MNSKFVGIVLIILEILLTTNLADALTLRQKSGPNTFRYACPGVSTPCLKRPKNCKTKCEATADFDTTSPDEPIQFNLKGAPLKDMYVLVGFSRTKNIREGNIFAVICADLGPDSITITPVWIDRNLNASEIPQDDPVRKMYSHVSHNDKNGILECSFKVTLDISYRGVNFTKADENIHIFLSSDSTTKDEPYIQHLIPGSTVVSEFHFSFGRVVGIVSEPDCLNTKRSNKSGAFGDPTWRSFGFIAVFALFIQKIF